MPKRSSSGMLLRIVILMVSIVLFVSYSCRYDPTLYPGYDILNPSEEVKVVGFTEEGDVIVTEAFILWVDELKSEVLRLRKMLEGED